MNPDIDLTQFGRNPAAGSPHVSSQLVAPPRRLMTRYGIPLGLVGGFVALGVYSARDALVPAVPVQVTQPAMLEVPGTAFAGGSSASAGTVLFEAPGWIEPAPYPVMLTSQVPGNIAKIHVLEGQRVTSGALVAELVATDAEIEVRRMEADLALRRAEMESARDNWENPTDLREQIATLEAGLNEMRAERDRASHTNRIAVRQAEIDLSLSRSGAGGEFPAEKAALEAKAADLAVAALDAKIQSTSAALAAARERMELRIEDRNRVRIAEAELERAEAALADARYRLSQRHIVAPMDGVIMSLKASEGSGLMPDVEGGMTVAAMYDPAHLQVRADVPLADAGKVREGLDAEVTIDGLTGRTFAGRLARIVHEADVLKNTLPVKVDILEPDAVLKPEMLARIRFREPAKSEGQESGSGDSNSTASLGKALFAPETLLKGDAGGKTPLWVVDGTGHARQREVVVGAGRREGLREVVSGLTLADKIIVSDTSALRDGVRVSASMEEAK